MFKRSTLTALAALMLFAGTKIASAADLAPPPPPAPEIRPSVTDWSGPYLGGVIGGTCMDTSMDFHTWDNDFGVNRWTGPLVMNGCGLSGGIVGGYNFQMDSIVFGLEGDFIWGSRTGEHTDVAWSATPPTIQRDVYEIDWMASIRPRIGWLMSANTMLYVTGGVSWLRGTLKDTGSLSGTSTSFSETHLGYVVGGGIEHALTENIHLRAEYLYSSYEDKIYGTFCATCANDGDSSTVSVNVREDLDNIHTFRLGVTWNFPVAQW
jgi:outer membrane immunogenic protein